MGSGSGDEEFGGGSADKAVQQALAATHPIGGIKHTPSTLAELNTKVSDTSLIPTTDARLSDARVPLGHGGTHEGGADPVTPAGIGAEPAFAKNTAFNKNFGAIGGDTCQGNDARLSDARVPLGHGGTHEGGADPITPAGIGAEPAFAKNTAFNKNFGAAAGTVVQGNDSRLDQAAKHKADVNLAGATPVQADVGAWAVGDRGFGIGTDSSIWWMYKDGAASVKSVQLT